MFPYCSRHFAKPGAKGGAAASARTLTHPRTISGLVKATGFPIASNILGGEFAEGKEGADSPCPVQP